MNGQIDVDRIKALRVALGLDQGDLAKRAGVDRSVVSRIERGAQHDVRASVLIALANALGVTVDSLLVSAHSPQETKRLITELTAAIDALSSLSPEHQRQVAALLATYIQTIPR